jgi:hypothetical protein
LNRFSYWNSRYDNEAEEMVRVSDKRMQMFMATLSIVSTAGMIVLGTGVSIICFGPPYEPIIITAITLVTMLFAKINMKAVDDLQNLGITATILALCFEYLY